jgi:mannose-6-phosphate isomerase-like protein (cupin superfamily)
VSEFKSITLPHDPTEAAPDGSAVRILLRLSGASMVHVTLPAGTASVAVAHRSVEEIWYVLSGRGQLWRRQGGFEEVTELGPGTCLTIPVGTHFQFRAGPGEPLAVLAVTVPPWPGGDEATVVVGPWPPTVAGAGR